MLKRRTFPRGIHPPDLKASTAAKPIEQLPPPERVHVPLVQHFGKPASALVKKGVRVCLGQKIGESVSAFCSPVHASVSGEVLAVDLHPFPSGVPTLAVTIRNDGMDTKPQKENTPPDPLALSREEIIRVIQEAGIVGLGGAAFPTAVKLSPPQGRTIDTLILNGCECEPVQTGDYRLMLEFPRDVLLGAELLRRAVGARRTIVGIEENKADALECFRGHTNGWPVELELLKTKYPQGAEKMLIRALLKRDVPRGGLPFEVGVVVQNVATAKAAWDAVSLGKPLYERTLTCSGPAVSDPKNLLVRLGTPIRHVIAFCGGLKDGAGLVTFGGPMMGISQADLETPVIKSTTGILAFPPAPPEIEFPCIRCGRCVEHCPMGLVPTRLAKLARFGHFGQAERWGNLDCIECGCCQYMCPSRIPLVPWIRLGKNRVAAARSAKGTA